MVDRRGEAAGLGAAGVGLDQLDAEHLAGDRVEQHLGQPVEGGRDGAQTGDAPGDLGAGGRAAQDQAVGVGRQVHRRTAVGEDLQQADRLAAGAERDTAVADPDLEQARHVDQPQGQVGGAVEDPGVVVRVDEYLGDRVGAGDADGAVTAEGQVEPARRVEDAGVELETVEVRQGAQRGGRRGEADGEVVGQVEREPLEAGQPQRDGRGVALLVETEVRRVVEQRELPTGRVAGLEDADRSAGGQGPGAGGVEGEADGIGHVGEREPHVGCGAARVELDGTQRQLLQPGGAGDLGGQAAVGVAVDEDADLALDVVDEAVGEEDPVGAGVVGHRQRHRGRPVGAEPGGQAGVGPEVEAEGGLGRGAVEADGEALLGRRRGRGERGLEVGGLGRGGGRLAVGGGRDDSAGHVERVLAGAGDLEGHATVGEHEVGREVARGVGGAGVVAEAVLLVAAEVEHGLQAHRQLLADVADAHDLQPRGGREAVGAADADPDEADVGDQVGGAVAGHVEQLGYADDGPELLAPDDVALTEGHGAPGVLRGARQVRERGTAEDLAVDGGQRLVDAGTEGAGAVLEGRDECLEQAGDGGDADGVLDRGDDRLDDGDHRAEQSAEPADQAGGVALHGRGDDRGRLGRRVADVELQGLRAAGVHVVAGEGGRDAGDAGGAGDRGLAAGVAGGVGDGGGGVVAEGEDDRAAGDALAVALGVGGDVDEAADELGVGAGLAAGVAAVEHVGRTRRQLRGRSGRVAGVEVVGGDLGGDGELAGGEVGQVESGGAGTGGVCGDDDGLELLDAGQGEGDLALAEGLTRDAGADDRGLHADGQVLAGDAGRRQAQRDGCVVVDGEGHRRLGLLGAVGAAEVEEAGLLRGAGPGAGDVGATRLSDRGPGVGLGAGAGLLVGADDGAVGAGDLEAGVGRPLAGDAVVGGPVGLADDDDAGGGAVGGRAAERGVGRGGREEGESGDGDERCHGRREASRQAWGQGSAQDGTTEHGGSCGGRSDMEGAHDRARWVPSPADGWRDGPPTRAGTYSRGYRAVKRRYQCCPPAARASGRPPGR